MELFKSKTLEEKLKDYEREQIQKDRAEAVVRAWNQVKVDDKSDSTAH